MATEVLKFVAYLIVGYLIALATSVPSNGAACAALLGPSVVDDCARSLDRLPRDIEIANISSREDAWAQVVRPHIDQCSRLLRQLEAL